MDLGHLFIIIQVINIQTVINDYSINKNKSLIKIIDLLGKKRLEIVKTSYSLFMKISQ